MAMSAVRALREHESALGGASQFQHGGKDSQRVCLAISRQWCNMIFSPGPNKKLLELRSSALRRFAEGSRFYILETQSGVEGSKDVTMVRLRGSVAFGGDVDITAFTEDQLEEM